MRAKKNSNNEWIQVQPEENVFVVNIGDMMSYFSNGMIKAASHRVRNSNSSKRYSWPFFFDPTWDVSLSKIQTFKQTSSYANISPEKEMFQIQIFHKALFQMAIIWSFWKLAEFEQITTYGRYVSMKYDEWFGWILFPQVPVCYTCMYHRIQGLNKC